MYATSIHDQYAAQSNSLENMCLAKCVVNYKLVPAPCESDDTYDVLVDASDSDDDNVDEIKVSSCWSEVIILCNNLGKIQKQKTQSILWVKIYQQNTNPEKYYHSSLILYLPWCNEDELIGSSASYKDHYVAVSDSVDHKAFSLHSEEINTAMNSIAKNGPPEIVWDTITPTIEE